MNNEFMQTIFNDCRDECYPIICAFSGDPEQGDWTGQVWKGKVPSRYSGEVNTYYTISSFKRNEAGRINRNKAQFAGMHTVCFDDIGTKIPWSYIHDSGLTPTYVIETSPNNFHVGFKVHRVDDFDKADKVLRAIIRDACNGVDSGMGNVSRYLRMPEGLNMKPAYVNGVAGFRHVLEQWNPDVVYHIDEVIEAFGLDLDSEKSVVSGESSVMAIDRELLRLDTLIETEEGEMTFGEYRDSSYGKLRAQATWCRPESVTWNGYLDRHKDGEPHFVDNGTQTKYVLGVMALFEVAYSIPEIPTDLFSVKPKPVNIIRKSTEVLSVDEMVDRFVFVASGSFVIDAMRTGVKLTYKEYQLKYKGSYTDYESERGAVKRLQHTDMWLADNRRVTADRVMFTPKAPNIVMDNRFGLIFNEWQEPRFEGYDPRGWELFMDHITWLVPDEGERDFFMQWCAHMVQKPNERPHTFIVMVTPIYGTGRSAVIEILSRIVGYHKTFDINKILSNGFNDIFSSTILLTTEEAFQSFRDRGEISSKLRELSTIRRMTINAKFEKQREENIYARMLLCSNHINPIDVDAEDRRAVIITNPMCTRYVPKSAESEAYFGELYDIQYNDAQLNSIYQGLLGVDISRFNASQHAPMTTGKQRLLSSNTSDDDHEIKYFIGRWESDIVTKEDIMHLVMNNRGGISDRNAIRKAVIGALNRCNAVKTMSRIKVQKVDGVTETKSELWILRNWDKWSNADHAELRAELYKGRYGEKTAGTNVIVTGHN